MPGPFLRESAWRWLATILGFGGVPIAANPTGTANLTPALLALFAALCWAIATLLARSMTKGISTATMMLGSFFAFVAVCGALRRRCWRRWNIQGSPMRSSGAG